MSVSLLDVNVLLALLDEAHVHHLDAHRWFSRNRQYGWASCPLTINGCMRIMSNPAYPGAHPAPTELASALRDLGATRDHHYWPGSVSLLDETLFRSSEFVGHRQITDIYLLGLAVRNHGRLATFDHSIPLRPVVGATTRNLVHVY